MLKQIQETKRIIFLAEFTEELIKNSIQPNKQISKKPNEIEVARLRQKFIESSQPEIAMEKVSQTPFLKSKYTKELEPKAEFQKSPMIGEIHKVPYVFNPENNKEVNLPEIKKQNITDLRKPIFKRIRIPRQRLRQVIKNIPIKSKPVGEEISIKQIYPEPSIVPKDFNLGKIQHFVEDNSIQSIECTGPGKPIFVKTFGRTNSTRITLSVEEIKQIIEEFSRYAKIPPVRGILKAAVGNIIISAVSSEYVGSRFIINKIPSHK